MKTILVTGATAGIGLHTAAALAGQGARVIVTGRDETRGRAAVAELRRRAGHDEVHFLAVDHATIGANRSLAGRIARRVDRLDVLINNVGGGGFAERRETADGHEATLAVNFLGPAALTDGLLSLLRESAPARIVNVVSSAHAMWKRDPFEDPELRRRYVGIEAYARAKLLNVLWTFELARRLEGTGVTANATNPGMAWTPGTQSLTPRAVPAWRFVWPLVRWLQRRASPEAAARSPVFLAWSDTVAGVSGAYFESDAKLARPSACALDARSQRRAWELAASCREPHP